MISGGIEINKLSYYLSVENFILTSVGYDFRLF